jgi:hypothetical protein
MRRWRAASACRICARSWKTWPSPKLDPEARNSIVTHFARLDMVGGDRVGRIADQIKRSLAEHGMEAWVYGRGKRPFSIWRKLQTKKLSFEQLSDIFGFRVIVGFGRRLLPRLGIIHTSWQMVPERFKDFISTPKPNGYRSIHTTVIGPEKQRVEIQIAPRRCTTCRSAASPRIGAIASMCPMPARSVTMRWLAAGHGGPVGEGRQRGRRCWSIHAWPCTRTRSSASRPRVR